MGAGHLYVLKDKLAGKISPAEQGAFAGTQGKKMRVFDLWKKEQQTQEEYKNHVERKLERRKLS